MKICMAGSLLTIVHCPMAKLHMKRGGYLTAHAIGSGGRENVKLHEQGYAHAVCDNVMFTFHFYEMLEL